MRSNKFSSDKPSICSLHVELFDVCEQALTRQALCVCMFVFVDIPAHTASVVVVAQKLTLCHKCSFSFCKMTPPQCNTNMSFKTIPQVTF